MAYRAIFLHFLCTAWAALSLGGVAASSPLDSVVRVRTPPGMSESDVMHAIRHEIGLAAIEKRDKHYTVNTTFDTSWDGAVLLKL